MAESDPLRCASRREWAGLDSNQRPRDYEAELPKRAKPATKAVKDFTSSTTAIPTKSRTAETFASIMPSVVPILSAVA
jgi:hypothetical protein